MDPHEIRHALVIGAGTMGPGIAQVYAMAGCGVDLVDTRSATLDRAGERVRESLERLVEFGVVPSEELPVIAERIRYTTDLAAVAPAADVVTEAINEDYEAKRGLYTALDELLRPGTLLASNTSGLDVFTLLEDVTPARLPDLIIHHYFLPATIIPLVEVVTGPRTSPETLERSLRLLERLGRAPVVLRRFHPNFIVNSLQVALGEVVAALLSAGVASPEEIDRAVKLSLGVRLPIVGVAQTLDFTGLDLVARLLRTSDRDASYFERLAVAGRTGVKAGAGLYDYANRTAAEVEAIRDRRYWQHLQALKNLGAFEPL